MPMRSAYKRVLLKLSGEALMCSSQKFGIEQSACEQIAQSVKAVCQLGVQIGIVVGGGNIFRGTLAEKLHFERTSADQIGMLATIINGLILQQSLMAAGIEARVLSAIGVDGIVERYTWHEAMRYLEKGIAVIFVGGTGNPYFTTDTAAALRASEIHAEIVLKATKVNGIYSSDPMKDSKAKKIDKLSYARVLAEELGVMDATSIALCRENKIPICVFNLFEKDALLKAVCGESVGSLVVAE